MYGCAIRSGMGQKTKVHRIGDGAPWVREQTDRVSGGQGTFLTDFYHLVICPMRPQCVHVPIFRRFPTDRNSLRRRGG